MWQNQEQKLTYIQQVRSGISSNRSMDDLEELVLNASEIKAITTNNPYIREKMDLENKLASLSVLRSQLFSEKTENKLEITRIENQLPAMESYLSGALEDSQLAQSYQAISSENYSLSLNGQRFQEKDKAGLFIAEKASRASQEEIIGQYGGFELRVKPNIVTELLVNPKVYLKGKNSYAVEVNPASGFGTIQRLDNLIRDTIASKGGLMSNI